MTGPAVGAGTIEPAPGASGTSIADRDDRMSALHDGLRTLRRDLDGLRAAAEAAIAAATGTTPVGSASADPAAASGPAASPDPAPSEPGRRDVASDVIRGLDDAAARLRAQVPAPSED